MKILYLTQWYPNRYDAMEGLFVRKHAQAAQLGGCEVHVLALRPYEELSKTEFSSQTINGVHEHILYTPTGRAIAELRNIITAWRLWHKQYGVPDAVHLNVITKWGLLARYLHTRHNTPYIITEHWSGYLPENMQFTGTARRAIARYAVNGAHAVTAVSGLLRDAMIQCGLQHSNFSVLPNVVDDFFYTHTPKENITARPEWAKHQFVHVSCFDNRAKNTLDIIRATALLRKQRNDFRMVMVGTGIDIEETQQLADSLGLIACGTVVFTGEQTPEQVKVWLDSSDCFVLYSNYETAAVVLQEAAACRLPIISTAVGLAPELIGTNTITHPSTNPIDTQTITTSAIVEPRNPEALASAMARHCKSVDQTGIIHCHYPLADTYRLSIVATQLHTLYRAAKGQN